MSDGGHIRLWRKVRKNGMMRNHILFTFWMWCLTGAAFKTHTVLAGNRKITLEPGQLLMTVSMAAYEIGANPRQIRTCLATLAAWENLTIKTTNKYSIITITNWAAYQVVEIQNDKQKVKQATSKRQATDKPLILEEGKEWKEGKESSEEIAASPSPPISILGIPKTKTPKQIPDDLALTPEMISYATSLEIGNVQRIFEAFKAHHSNKGTKGLSWGQGWITWCNNETKFKGGNGGAPRKTFAEIQKETNERNKRAFLDAHKDD